MQRPRICPREELNGFVGRGIREKHEKALLDSSKRSIARERGCNFFLNCSHPFFASITKDSTNEKGGVTGFPGRYRQNKIHAIMRDLKLLHLLLCESPPVLPKTSLLKGFPRRSIHLEVGCYLQLPRLVEYLRLDSRLRCCSALSSSTEARRSTLPVLQFSSSEQTCF